MKKIKMVIVSAVLAMIMFGTSVQAQQLALSSSDSATIALKQVKRWIEYNVLPLDTTSYATIRYLDVKGVFHRSCCVTCRLPKRFLSINEIIAIGKTAWFTCDGMGETTSPEGIGNGKLKQPMLISCVIDERNWVEVRFTYTEHSYATDIRIDLGEFCIYYSYNDVAGDWLRIDKRDIFNKVDEYVAITSQSIFGDLKIAPFIFGK